VGQILGSSSVNIGSIFNIDYFPLNLKYLSILIYAVVKQKKYFYCLSHGEYVIIAKKRIFAIALLDTNNINIADLSRKKNLWLMFIRETRQALADRCYRVIMWVLILNSQAKSPHNTPTNYEFNHCIFHKNIRPKILKKFRFFFRQTVLHSPNCK